MKQTAIEWLMDEAMKLVVQYIQGTLNEDTLDDVIYELGTKAKAMEKEQIIESYCIGCADITKDNNIFPRETSEQYYNETFKSE